MPMQLRFLDQDVFGHVNNSVYFTLFDTCKLYYLKEVLGEAMLKEIEIVAVHMEIDYLSQVFFMDDISVQTCTSHIGNKSITFVQRVVDTKTKEIKAEGRTIMVTFSRKDRCPIPVPAGMRSGIAAFECWDAD